MREAGYTLHRVAIDFKHARAATTAMVPQAREWQAKNHEFLKQRFRNYMVSRRFNFPTIIKRNAARGDVLLTTAVIRGLKSIRPLSPIFVETHCPEALERNPDIFHVGASVPYSPDALQINLNGISEMNPAVPIVDAYAACAGIELEDETTSIYPPQPDIEWAKRTVDSSWVAVFAGPTTWRCKNWPFDRWSEVIRWLQESGVRVVLVGGDPVPPTLKADLDLRSRTTVGQLGALLGEVGLFVGLDSFPIHVAQAMKTPVVGLFGITSADKILTRGSHWIAVSSDPDHPGTGLRHKIAGKTHVDHPDNPMDTISVDQVKAAISEMLPALSGRKTQ
jgi:ADP-heptose:LPS heptosyltransferase